MLVSFAELKAKLDKEKLKEKLTKLPWKRRPDGGYDTHCYFNYKYGEVNNQVDDDCFIQYPSPICANFLSLNGTVTLVSFMWIERTDRGGCWRYLKEEDGVVPFFTPGSYAEAQYLKEIATFITSLEF